MLPFSSCAYACVCFYIRRTHTHVRVHTYIHTFAQSPFRHLFSLSSRTWINGRLNCLHTERSAYLEGCSGGPGVPAYVLPGSGILGLQVRSLITLKTRKLALEMQVLGGREQLTSYEWGWSPSSLLMHSNSILETVHAFSECLVCKVVSSLGFVFKCLCISSPSFWLTWICPESLTIFPLSSSSILRKQSGDKINEKYELFFLTLCFVLGYNQLTVLW